MRAFLSIHLSESVQNQVGRLQNQLAPELPGIRWTRPANCHLTLKFLGDIEPATETAIANCLPGVAMQFSPFTVEFKGVGQFPPRGALSVLWIGVEQGGAALLALEAAVREGLRDADVEFDAQSFVPHLTIARAPRGRKIFLRSPKRFESFSLATMTVSCVSLMQSVLDPKGAIYTERVRFPFSAG
ncbi:MAG: RNA 2',3'-cyclic phosphodiesterase [Candidatus Hinthialibacter antarcticus]|nr:RNA 2',3'-cyclic phosphodiesterase [Candidatus Hinthialibacter antarcticus]